MKKFNTFKIVQLILLIILTAVSLYMLMQPEVKQYIFDSTPATVLFIIVWAVLLVTFVFLLIDFSLISSMILPISIPRIPIWLRIFFRMFTFWY